MFCPSIFTIDGHEFTDIHFRFVPQFKGSDITLGLPTLIKKLDVGIHLSLNSFTMGDLTIHGKLESRRISCMIVDADKMNQIIVEQARKKKNLKDVFLISLHFATELAISKVILENILTNDLTGLSRNFADITEKPRGLPPQRRHLDN